VFDVECNSRSLFSIPTLTSCRERWVPPAILFLGTGEREVRLALYLRPVKVTWDNLRVVESSSVPQYGQVVFDTTNPRASAEFWRQLLGLFYREGHEPPEPGHDDPAGRDWLNLFTPGRERCLAFQKVDDLPRSTWPESDIPQQLHLDLTVKNLDELNAVHSRVLDLGGQLRYDRSSFVEEPLRVYADLDGHPFCVFVSA
jgi:hypothetical protein